MKKKFKEVFQTIIFTDYYSNLLDNVYVENVITDKNYSYFKIYILSKVIILKKDIAEIEKIMTLKLRRSITIVERYELANEYSASSLFEMYQKELEVDLLKEGSLYQRMYRDAKCYFVDDELIIDLPKYDLYEMRAMGLKKKVEEIFAKRFSSILIVKFRFYEVETGKVKLSDKINASMMANNNEVEKNVEISKENILPKEDIYDEDTKKKKCKRKVAQGLLFGSNVDGEVVKISDTNNIPGEYVFNTMVINVDNRQTKTGKYIINFDVTDFSDSISGKLFAQEDELEDIFTFIKKDSFIKIKAKVEYDDYDKSFMMSRIIGIKEINSFLTSRSDTAPVKRIELCTHTKMSKMESVCDIEELIKLAHNFGHEAIAISDFGVVHGFPNAMHTVEKLDNFKMIYGMSANVVDDATRIVNINKDYDLNQDMVVFDIETTGFNASFDKIIEIGAVRIHNGEIESEFFQEFVNPNRPLSYEIIELTHITDEDLIGAKSIDIILPKFIEFCKDSVLVAHNASFDMSFISKNAKDLNIDFSPTVLDTLMLSRRLLSDVRNYKLGTLAKKFNISLVNAHRAKDDANATAGVLIKLMDMVNNLGIKRFSEVDEVLALRKEDIREIYPFNASLLVKNDIGRVNLYTLVSISHLEYFEKNAKIPKSLLGKYRDGLLIGSGTVDGEFQQALLRGVSDTRLEEIVDFYDYLEVQPPSHYLSDSKQFLNMDMVSTHLRKIIDIARKYNKLVVATGNVHFINKEDSVYRKIIKFGDKKKLKFDAPLYFMTTNEMLEEFSFLGEDIAYEIVVENTHKINKMIENISPVRPDKCPPVIENSDIELREMCYKKAKSIYGENLPKQVEERLTRELNSIISNGFAVLYIIAQKLVKKSNEDGYLVGSRGSVGSSFVATMSGITEVNPLPAHYYCSKCHYVDFEAKEIKENEGISGCDLPDKLCPNCNTKLEKEGFDIPFETFLGFKGNKEPDIDLNFSGDYQSQAHKETEVIFGEGHTFRAGTISGVAEKTAYGYVKGYFEKLDINKRHAEINRLSRGVQGVKRTTGQHPGGIIVLPHGENMYSFTPVQRPADDPTSNIITTHFDYHSIDHNLLKLDILGHDDPTMIRKLMDLTGIDATKIPLDEPKVMTIFHSPEALGVTSKDILGCEVGCRGIPEFGTEFTIQMVIDTKPQNFSDLIKISGLSHGTDVWLGNAKELIDNNVATISECICTRDDIMTFLISKGIEKELSFTIMESVRKGKGLKAEWEEIMRKNNIADWYIDSCNKIKYMFPKAHAVAYVMMAYRIAYFKVYYPLEYYTAFFSIRASAFDYGLMCRGKTSLEHSIEEYKALKNPTNTEKDKLKDMLMVQEFYARGYEFAKIDLDKVNEKDFQIVDGKVMPSLAVIDGLGEKAAKLVVKEARKSKFISKMDMKKRCKLSQTTIEFLDEYGIISSLPDDNQTSIFDFI